jgi:hypothetical protein
MVREGVTDAELLELALLENVQRQDLTPLEEANGYARMLELEPALTQEAMARRLGIAQSTVANALRLLRLPDAVRALLDRGELPKSHGIALCSMADSPKECVTMALQAQEEDWPLSRLETSVRAFRQAEEKRNQPDLPLQEETEPETPAPAAPAPATANVAAVADAITRPIEPAKPVETPPAIVDRAPAEAAAPVPVAESAPAPTSSAAAPDTETVGTPPDGPRVATSIRESDSDWLWENDLTIDRVLDEYRAPRSFRLTPLAHKCLKALTDRYNDNHPDGPISLSARLEALLVSKAQDAGYDVAILESLPE